MTKDEQTNFLKELKELMQKHHIVGIGAYISGDTHGIEDKFGIQYQQDRLTSTRDIVLLPHESWLWTSDINDNGELI